MASAAVTNEPLTEDYSCGYCLQKLPYMEDPRQLPCSHVFCLPCLQKDLEEVMVLQCNICSRQHDIETLESLPIPVISDSDCGRPCQDEQVPCDICTEDAKDSGCYCPDCDKKMCEEHQKVHSGSVESWRLFSGADHKTMSIEEMRRRSVKSQQAFCSDHRQTAVTLACGACHQTFCTLCQTDSSCPNFSALEVSHHAIVRLDQLGDLLREDLKPCMKSLSETITYICKLEKTAWRVLDDIEKETRIMTEEVDKAAEQQISETKSQASTKKCELSTRLSTNTSEIEKYTSELMTWKDSLQDTWRATVATVKMSDFNMCKAQKGIAKNAKEMLAQPPPNFHVSGYLPSLSEQLRKLQILFIGTSVPPTTLENGKSTDDGCDIVLWNRENNLVAVRGKEVQLFDKCLSKLKSVSIEKNIIKSLIERGPTSALNRTLEYIAFVYNTQPEFVFYGGDRRPRDILIQQLGFFSADFDQFTLLDKYQNTIPQTELHKHMHKVTINRLTSQIIIIKNQQVMVYSSNGDMQYTITLSNLSCPKFIYALEDTSVLVADESNSIYKYIFHPPPTPVELVWTSEKFNISSAMDVDSAGLIYVGSGGSIQVISPSGKLLNKLTHQKLQSVSIFDVAVSKSGRQIAVACGEKGLKLFNLSRQIMQ